MTTCRYDYCARCKLPFAVTRAGRMYPHKNPHNMNEWCKGSALPPLKKEA